MIRGLGSASGGVGEAGDAQVDGFGAAGADLVHLGEFGVGAGEADLQALGLAVPAVRFGFGDAGEEVVTDLVQPCFGGGVWAQQRAAQTAVFVDAGGVIGAAAVTDGNLAALEVPDEPIRRRWGCGIPGWGAARGGGR